jgi:hypothetical protein
LVLIPRIEEALQHLAIDMTLRIAFLLEDRRRRVSYVVA